MSISRDDVVRLGLNSALQKHVISRVLPDDRDPTRRNDQDDPVGILEQGEQRLKQLPRNAFPSENFQILLHDRSRNAEEILAISDAIQEQSGGAAGEKARNDDVGIDHKTAHRRLVPALFLALRDRTVAMS